MTATGITMTEFIERYPGAQPGVSVNACALLVEVEGEQFCLAGRSAEVWDVVRRRKIAVVSVLYAGDDRNAAEQVARTHNAKNK